LRRRSLLNGMVRWARSIGLTGALVVTCALVAPAAAATGHAHAVRVRFVLTPTWLPAGYSASGGGWVTPAGGLHVYPDTQVSASRIEVGSQTSTTLPVLFTFAYFGFHDPESKSIRLTATPVGSSVAPLGSTVTLGRRHVALASSTQGVFHNPVTNASWTENGDAIVLIAQGLRPSQVSQFISGLAERTPSHA
jgi:hypothetical protein